jgi:hypothetical protein
VSAGSSLADGTNGTQEHAARALAGVLQRPPRVVDRHEEVG